MADMANKASIKSFVYGSLSFLVYDLDRPRLDTEWLLSLCLTPPCYQLQKPPETAALFLGVFVTSLETIKSLAAGLSSAGAQ
jgi:hypothetical protein